MVLRRLCVRYSGNVSIWPGAGEVISSYGLRGGATLGEREARICDDGAQVILSAGEPGVRGPVGASWRASLR